MTSAEFLGQIDFLRKGKETTRGVNLGAVDYHSAVVKGRFGEEYALDKRGRNFGIDDNAAVDNRFGHVSVGENYYRADVVFGHILNGFDDFVDTMIDVLRRRAVFDYVLGFGNFFSAEIPDIPFDFRCEKNENRQNHRRKHEKVRQRLFVLFSDEHENHARYRHVSDHHGYHPSRVISL